ncbi:MAG: hypothetical protein O6857_07590 [Nitrospinae bacterium]|nr:hypothetical protein [Nitrospinota bacterium]
MKYCAILAILILTGASPVLADGGHHHEVPTLSAKTKTVVTMKDQTLTVTFGPIDLPVGHSGDLAASMPKHTFELPEDMYLVGYKANVYLQDGTPLPQQYLHHILLMDNNKESVSCPGEPQFFAGAGMEMTEARFPKGYGVKLGKGHKLTALVAFYHKVPPTRNVMASFTMQIAPKGSHVEPMEVYQVGVNIVCFSKFGKRAKDETDEGMLIRPGVDVRSAPLKFSMDGCTKFAYPHGHDQLLLIALENITTGKTLLRTVPDVALDGAFKAFQPHQVYKNAAGFAVNTRDEYVMTMVHHKALDDKREQYGMGNYLMYMTPGPCPSDQSASTR